MTSGFQPSDFIIIAGRPSMGKTAFALNIAKYAGVEDHKRVLVLSLEMSKEQLVQRLLCAEAKVDSHKVRTGYLDPRDWTRLTNAAGRLAEAPIFIDDSPALTVLEARAKARRMKAEHGLDLIVIDYLQLMRGRNPREPPAGDLGDLALAQGAGQGARTCPVVALSQLSRAVDLCGLVPLVVCWARTSSPTARPGRSPSSPRRRRAGSSMPRHVLDKLCVGPVAAGPVDIRLPPARTSPGSPPSYAGPSRDITVVILERPRHEALIAEVRRGRRPDQADQRRRPVGGDQLRGPGHRRPRRHGDRRRAGGRPHRRRAALPRRRDPGPLPLPQRRGARPRRVDGSRRRGAGLHDRGPRAPARTSSSRRPA